MRFAVPLIGPLSIGLNARSNSFYTSKPMMAPSEPYVAL